MVMIDPTKDGTTIRDYIHIMDLAEAHIKILNHILKMIQLIFI